MSYYLVVFIRKINSLCFTTAFQQQQNTGGQLHLHLLFQKQPPEVFFEKGVLRNFEKFLRTPFYRAPPNNCFFLLLNSDNLLTGQQKIDLCYIKKSFQIYELSLLNKKLIEVFFYILN